jgi:hypothetical protein
MEAPNPGTVRSETVFGDPPVAAQQHAEAKELVVAANTAARNVATSMGHAQEFDPKCVDLA